MNTEIMNNASSVQLTEQNKVVSLRSLGAPVNKAIDIGNVPDDWIFSFQSAQTLAGYEKTESQCPIGERFVLSLVYGHFFAGSKTSSVFYVFFSNGGNLYAHHGC